MIENFYNDTVTIYRITEGISTVTGENVKTASTVTTDLKCKIRPMTNQESFYQHKNNLEITHYMYSAVSTLFQQLDRIVFGTSTFEVTGIINPMQYGRYQRAGLKAVI